MQRRKTNWSDQIVGQQVWCASGLVLHPNMMSPLMVVEIKTKVTHKQKATHKLYVYELLQNQALCFPPVVTSPYLIATNACYCSIFYQCFVEPVCCSVSLVLFGLNSSIVRNAFLLKKNQGFSAPDVQIIALLVNWVTYKFTRKMSHIAIYSAVDKFKQNDCPKVMLPPFQIIGHLTFFSPKFDHLSYSNNLCKHSQI